MSDRRQPWMKWYPADWRADPCLRMCSLAARGLWMELLGFMHEAEPYGHLVIGGRAPTVPQIAALVGVDAKTVAAALAELEGSGVCSRDEDGRLLSRRMVRDKARADAAVVNGRAGGNPNLMAPDLTPRQARQSRFKHRDNPTKVAAVWEACGGICCDCGVPMQRDRSNAPDAFTIDHITPIARGGTNEVDNLRGVCRACNFAKGVNPTRSSADNLHQTDADKAQKPEARDTSSLRSDGPSAAPPAPDVRTALFTEGLARLMRITGKPDRPARSLLGRFLSDAADDAALVGRLLFEAEQHRKASPVAWIEGQIGLATGRAPGRGRAGPTDGIGDALRRMASPPRFHGATVDGRAEEVVL